MKTLTLNVSDEFAKNLETLHGIFCPEDKDAGRTLDVLTGWHLRNIATNDSGAFFDEVADWTCNTIEDAEAAVEAADAILGEDKPYTWVFAHTAEDGPFSLVPLHTKQHEEIWEACVERDVPYDGDTRYLIGFRMKEAGMTALQAVDAILAEVRQRKEAPTA